MAICVAVLSREHSPLYVRTVQTVAAQNAVCSLSVTNNLNNPGNDLRLQFVVHTAVDVVVEKVAAYAQGTVDARDGYLGLVLSNEDHRVFAYVTNTQHTLLLVTESSNVSFKDSDIRAIFKKLHTAFVEALLNPFYAHGEAISSPQFDAVVQSVMLSQHA